MLFLIGLQFSIFSFWGSKVLSNYLERIKNYNIRQASIVPERAALLIIDCQQRFGYAVAPILDNIISLVRCCRESGIKVIFTRHGHHEPVDENCMMSIWWGGLAKYGTPEWEILEELQADPERDLIIDKDTYSAFYQTDLEDEFRRSGVSDLIICGVFTNCCCETTARAAFVFDYRVFFVADATAASSEDIHICSLKSLAHSCAYVIDTKQVILPP